MKNEYYYEIWKSKKWAAQSDWSVYEYSDMEVIEAESATQALKEIRKIINAVNELQKNGLDKYQARNLREI